MEPDLDDELRRLFDGNAARELPSEPFLSDTRRGIAVIRSRRRIARAFARILVIALIALASPWLIEGSELLSRGLEFLFARLSEFFAAPAGIGLVAVALAMAYLYRRRHYR